MSRFPNNFKPFRRPEARADAREAMDFLQSAEKLGALLPTAEFDLRRTGRWAPERQHRTTTVCPYCGVGCNLTLHVQDNEIFKVSSPSDHDVAHGNLCIKGRFGYVHVQPPRRRERD